MSGDKAKPLSDDDVLSQSDAFRKGILRGIKDVFRSEAEMKIRKNKREALQIFAEAYSDLKKVYDVIYNIQSKYMTDHAKFSDPGRPSSERSVNTMSIEALDQMCKRIGQIRIETDKLASNPLFQGDFGAFAEQQELQMGQAIDFINTAEQTIGIGSYSKTIRERLTTFRQQAVGEFVTYLKGSQDRSLEEITVKLDTFSYDIAQSALQEVGNNISKIQTDAQLSYELRNQLKERQVLDVIGKVEHGLTEEEFDEFEGSLKAIKAMRKGKESNNEDPVQRIFEIAKDCEYKYEKIRNKVQYFREELKEKLNAKINALDAKIREIEDYAKQIEKSRPDLKTVFENLLNLPALEGLTGQDDVARSPYQQLEEAKKALTIDSITGNELWEKIQRLHKHHEDLSQESTRSLLLDAVATTQAHLNKAGEHGYSDNDIKNLIDYIGKVKNYFENKKVNTNELLKMFQKMNKNYKKFFRQYLENIEGTKTAKRFKNCCDQEDLQLWNDAQDYPDGDAVT